MSPRPEGVDLLWDVDKRGSDALAALEQARSEKPWPFAVAVGACDTKRECWILNGFTPCNEEERKLLEAARQELGLNPTIDGHQLTASQPNAKRDAKRVFALLVTDEGREEACWRNSALSVLETRGKRTGLAAYLAEIRDRLVPLFRG